jgi:hypothetical protein
LQSYIVQQKERYALKGSIFLRLLAAEKYLARLSKLVILVFQQAGSFLTLPRDAQRGANQ